MKARKIHSELLERRDCVSLAIVLVRHNVLYLTTEVGIGLLGRRNFFYSLSSPSSARSGVAYAPQASYMNLPWVDKPLGSGIHEGVYPSSAAAHTRFTRSHSLCSSLTRHGGLEIDIQRFEDTYDETFAILREVRDCSEEVDLARGKGRLVREGEASVYVLDLVALRMALLSQSSSTEIPELLKTSLEPFPAIKPRLAMVHKTPHGMLHFIDELGIDLFKHSLATGTSDWNYVVLDLTFSFPGPSLSPIDMSGKKNYLGFLLYLLQTRLLIPLRLRSNWPLRSLCSTALYANISWSKRAFGLRQANTFGYVHEGVYPPSATAHARDGHAFAARDT
ncbi:hypothetical protein BDQ17DRAFT_1330710 [Cyathus striatus]|nr:hypothetical protein BDQ17DRAFT_1330710 [Cyathus striatus]